MREYTRKIEPRKEFMTINGKNGGRKQNGKQHYPNLFDVHTKPLSYSYKLRSTSWNSYFTTWNEDIN